MNNNNLKENQSRKIKTASWLTRKIEKAPFVLVNWPLDRCGLEYSIIPKTCILEIKKDIVKLATVDFLNTITKEVIICHFGNK